MRPEEGSSNRAIDLFDHREGHYGDAFQSANLIEAGRSSEFELPQDKIYGFVGIAHDCEDGSFPVDYSKLLLEVYQDTGLFNHKSSNSSKMGGIETLVHFSVLFQRLLGIARPMVENGQDISRFSLPRLKDEDSMNNTSVIGGFNGGSIEILGPSCGDVVGEPFATKSWNIALRSCIMDRRQLRQENAAFVSKVIKLESEQLGKSKAVGISPNYWWRIHGSLSEPESPMFKFGSPGAALTP